MMLWAPSGFKLHGCFLKWWVFPQIIHFKRFSIINHTFCGTTIFGNTHMGFEWFFGRQRAARTESSCFLFGILFGMRFFLPH